MASVFQERHYPESRFGGFTDIDGTLVFFSRVNALLRREFTVLDVGCGRGSVQDDPIEYRRNLRILKGKVQRVIGIDPDPKAHANPFVDEFRLMNGKAWPVSDEYVDMIISDQVLEHLPAPDDFFKEASRVLRNSGVMCLRTTNRLSYVGLMASLVPNQFHARVTSLVQSDRLPVDVFPTRYKCNTVSTIRRALRRHGFSGVCYGFEAEPSYLDFSGFAYLLGVLHQKFAPQVIRPTIFAFATVAKPVTRAAVPPGISPDRN